MLFDDPAIQEFTVLQQRESQEEEEESTKATATGKAHHFFHNERLSRCFLALTAR